MSSKINYFYLSIFLLLKINFLSCEIIEVNIGGPEDLSKLNKGETIVSRGDFFQEIMGFKESELIKEENSFKKSNSKEDCCGKRIFASG